MNAGVCFGYIASKSHVYSVGHCSFFDNGFVFSFAHNDIVYNAKTRVSSRQWLAEV